MVVNGINKEEFAAPKLWLTAQTEAFAAVKAENEGVLVSRRRRAVSGAAGRDGQVCDPVRRVVAA